jgi:hypothetical protein
MRPVMVSPRSDGDQRFRGAFPLGDVQHRSRAVIKLSRAAGPKMAAAQSPLVLEIAYRRFRPPDSQLAESAARCQIAQFCARLLRSVTVGVTGSLVSWSTKGTACGTVSGATAMGQRVWRYCFRQAVVVAVRCRYPARVCALPGDGEGRLVIALAGWHCRLGAPAWLSRGAAAGSLSAPPGPGSWSAR